jgi:hypothetical protein
MGGRPERDDRGAEGENVTGTESLDPETVVLPLSVPFWKLTLDELKKAGGETPVV